MTAVPPLIPGDTNLASSHISILRPDQVLGPYTSWKVVVIAVSTANVTTLIGLQTIDGVTLVEGDRVLLTAQTSGINNGIYKASANEWQRTNDLEPGVNAAGVTVLVNQGTLNANSVWICTNEDGFDIVGINSLTFVTLVGLLTTVSGPGVSTNTAIPTWNGTTGTKLNNSTVLLSPSGNITGATITDPSDNVAANSLKTVGNNLVNVSNGPTPTLVGQVLTTSSTSTAVWQTGVDYLNTGTSLPTPVGTVNVSNSAAPAIGDVLIATTTTAASWFPQLALTGVPSSVGYAEFNLTTNSNGSVPPGTAFLVSTQVSNSVPLAIVASAGAGGTVWTLSAGTYVIDYEMSLGSAGSVALYTGPSAGSLAVDNNTVAGSSTATTWIHGRAVEVVGTTLVVAVSSVVGTAAVVTAGTDAGSYMIRVTFLKIA